jgi:hypothetical protein
VQPVFYIPNDTEIVVVADFFAEDLLGGAELTLQAILDKSPYKLFKMHSSMVTAELVEKNKDKYWLLGNIAKMGRESLINVASDTRFSKIECDYLYCVFRSSHLHKLQTGQDCDCHLRDSGRFVQGLYKRADHVFFMSQGQEDEYKRLFPSMREWPLKKFVIQGSTFKDETLDRLDVLFAEYERKKNGKWAVLGGGTWIKNQQEVEEFCKKKKYEYDVIGGLPHAEFLEQMANYSGLVFHPKGFDTAPRITMEAKLLGLKMDLDENVQHRNETWFTGNREKAMIHLRQRAEKFWENINLDETQQD